MPMALPGGLPSLAEAAAAEHQGMGLHDTAPVRPMPAGDGEESESTDLSSAGSMTRQMTEVSEATCVDLMERQLTGFQSRKGDYWLRQCTTPAGQRKSADQSVLVGLKRQLSCPAPSRAKPGGRLGTGAPLTSIKDVEVESNIGSGGDQSRQVSSEDALDEGLLEAAICTVVTEMMFSVCVADPASMDADLIAVSEGFLTMSGYKREEVVGENCRFLHEGTSMPLEQRKQLSAAVETGAPFTALLVNKKKSGQIFLNLLDLRGLVVARNDITGEDIWLLVAVQQDVSNMARDRLPENHSSILQQVASRIRKKLVKHLNELGLSSAMCSFRLNPVEKTGAKGDKAAKETGRWSLSSETLWKPGEVQKQAVCKSLDHIPPELAQRFRLTRKAQPTPTPSPAAQEGARGLPQVLEETPEHPASTRPPQAFDAAMEKPTAGAGSPAVGARGTSVVGPTFAAAAQATHPSVPDADDEDVVEERYSMLPYVTLGAFGALAAILALRLLQSRRIS